jgi:hypothetical protein
MEAGLSARMTCALVRGLALLGVVMAVPTAAVADCSPAMVYDLQARGMPTWQIQQICGAKALPAPGAPAAVSATCATPSGTCALPKIALIGAPCWCTTATGQVAGSVR